MIGADVYNLEYSYNLAGQLVSEKYPSGKIVTNSYDIAGRTTGVSDQARTYLNSVGYLGTGGQVNSLALGNGTTEGFAYNDRLQLTIQN
jgi:YD repeat-containing protein